MRRCLKIIQPGRTATACIAVAVALTSPSAKTPDQLKSQFAALLGPGKYARIVWSKGGSNATSEQIYTYGSSATTIMALDTRDGIIRQLVPNQPSGHMINASFTWDGERVVFYNHSATQVLAVNWDGTNYRTVMNGCRSERCWEAQDGSDWFTGQIGNTLYRINLDNTATRVQLYSGITHWADLSPDGNYLAATFPDYPNAGVLNLVGQNSPLIFGASNSDNGGCWTSMARDNTHRVLYTIEPHTNYRIVEANGTQVLNQHVGAALLPSTLQYREYNALRWTNDPDIVTFWIDGGSKVNPIIQRVSNRQWVAINDSVTTVNEGNTDCWLYSETSSVSLPSLRPGAAHSPIAAQIFDIRGRTLSPAGTLTPRVRIAAVPGTAQGARLNIRY